MISWVVPLLGRMLIGRRKIVPSVTTQKRTLCRYKSGPPMNPCRYFTNVSSVVINGMKNKLGGRKKKRLEKKLMDCPPARWWGPHTPTKTTTTKKSSWDCVSGVRDRPIDFVLICFAYLSIAVHNEIKRTFWTQKLAHFFKQRYTQ